MVRTPTARPTHGSVVVELDGRSLLLDVALLTRVPLPLEPGHEPLADHPAADVTRLRLDDGRFVVLWRPLHHPEPLACRLESVGASAQDYALAYERSRVWSPFNYAISARATRDHEVIGIGMGRRVVLSKRGMDSGEPLTPDARTRVLVDELGISEELATLLPPDQRLPPAPETQAYSDFKPG